MHLLGQTSSVVMGRRRPSVFDDSTIHHRSHQCDSTSDVYDLAHFFRITIETFSADLDRFRGSASIIFLYEWTVTNTSRRLNDDPHFLICFSCTHPAICCITFGRSSSIGLFVCIFLLRLMCCDVFLSWYGCSRTLIIWIIQNKTLNNAKHIKKSCFTQQCLIEYEGFSKKIKNFLLNIIDMARLYFLFMSRVHYNEAKRKKYWTSIVISIWNEKIFNNLLCNTLYDSQHANVKSSGILRSQLSKGL